MKNRRLQLLSSNTMESIAIFQERYVSKNGGPISVFTFKIENNTIKSEVYKKFEHLQKGDTVLIKYSIQAPSIIEVLDKYYMKKYKHY